MSSQEDRESRQKKFGRRRKPRADKQADPKPGPEARHRRRERWSDEYAGRDPHDEDYWQDRPLNFHDQEG